MNRELINKVFSSRRFTTGSIVALYNFEESGTGCIVFNDYYSTGKQLVTGDITQPIFETYPAISVGCGNNVINNSPTNSGHFSYNDILRIGYSVTGDSRTLEASDWTFFVNYRKDTLESGNIGTVLATTMNSSTGASGFVFGVNAANHPFFEYMTTEGVKKGFTSNQALGVQNLLSVSKIGEEINITNHDIRGPLGIGHLNQNFNASGITHSDVWHLGNFPNTGGVNPTYTGFSGFMDEFFLMKGNMPRTDQDALGSAFFQTGIQLAYQSGYWVSGFKATGIEINSTGITGTGVTGMLRRIYDAVETCMCDQIIFYKDSGVTGYLRGEIVTFLSGTGIVSGQRYVTIPEQITYDYDYIGQYAERGISFKNKINSTDRYEIYSYTQFHDIPTLVNGSGHYQGGVDWYTMDAGYVGGNVNVYLNGSGLYSGTGYTIDAPNDAVKMVPPNVYTNADTMIYDKISGGSQVATVYTGFALTGISVTAAGTDYNSVPSVVFSGGGGAGAAATAITGDIGGGSAGVTSITVNSGGSGYTSVPNLTLSGGTPALSGTGVSVLDSTDISIAVTNKDVYVGRLKLISGLDYTQTATDTIITATQLQGGSYTHTGLYGLLFLPRYQPTFNRATGDGLQYVQTSFPLIDEQVWINGKRLLINKDYHKVSRLGLLKGDEFITGFNDSFYNLNIDRAHNFFNI